MTSLVQPQPSVHAALARCERHMTEKAAELTHRRAELTRLANHVDDLEADLKQARILTAYLRGRIADE